MPTIGTAVQPLTHLLCPGSVCPAAILFAAEVLM